MLSSQRTMLEIWIWRPVSTSSRLNPNMQVSYIHGSIIYSSSDLGTKEKIVSDGIEITPNSTNANRATIKFPVCDNFKLAHGTKVPEDIRAIKNIFNVLKSSIDIDDMTLNQVHEFHPYCEILDDEIVDTMDKNGMKAIYITSKTHDSVPRSMGISSQPLRKTVTTANAYS